MTAHRLARRDVIAPAAVLFAVMVAHTILETARDALFLARLGPERLAWVYLVMAGIALVAFVAIRKVIGVRDPRRVLFLCLGGAVAGTTAFAIALPAYPSLVFELYVWTGLVATLVVPCFWTVLDRSLKVGEAKRTFAAIGAGGVVGAMVGSAIAGALGELLPARHLVTAGALAYAAAAACTFAFLPRPVADEPVAPTARAELLTQRSRRYLRLLVVLGIVSTVALTLGDLVFKRVMAERLTTDELAPAFGAIYTGLNAVSLVIQLALTPRLLAKWGVTGALTVMPVIVLVTASGFAITGAALAAVALKLGDGGLRHSLHRVGSELLYLPMPASIRDRWKTAADAIVLRGGESLAALVAFATAVAGFGTQHLALVAGGAALGWLVALAVVRRAYLAQFRETLRAGEITRDARVPALDTDTRALLVEALSRPDEIEALAALDLLAGRAHIPALALYHPHWTVVLRALELLEAERSPELAPVLGYLLDHDDSRIRAAALAVSSRTRSHHARRVAALGDRDAGVRAAALAGFVGDADHGVESAAGIAALLAGTTDDRVALAVAVEHAGVAGLRDVLRALVARREPAVLRHVVHALARDPEHADIDWMIGLLELPRVRADARRALEAMGASGLDHALAALDDPRTPLAVRRHLPRTISRFGSPRAAAALVARLLREPDGTTEFKILRALGRMRAATPALPVDAATIRDYARRATQDAARFAVLHDAALAVFLPATPTVELLAELLEDKRRGAIGRAFRAVGVLEPRAGLRSVHDALMSGDDTRRAAAREIFDLVVPTELREPLLSAIDGHVPGEQLDTPEAVATALLAERSESIRCVIAHHIADSHLVELRGDLAQQRPLAGHSLVMAAFDQAIERLDA